jgi:hypothetical protein
MSSKGGEFQKGGGSSEEAKEGTVEKVSSITT